MTCCRLTFSLFKKLSEPFCYQCRAAYRRSVMPVNTYYRFKKKEQSRLQPQIFKYFLVVDFEATCDDAFIPDMEIIEFPCFKVNANTFETLDTFHMYVRPVIRPILTPFCTSLTGIHQDMVDDKLTFPEVLDKFLAWVNASDVDLRTPHPNSCFVTCGDWDFMKMLPNQCKLSGTPIPQFMTSWINIKKSFLNATGLYPHGIKDMLRQLNLQHEGRLHSGIDDCKNIIKIMQGIAERGHVFQVTKSLPNHEKTS
ncbi:ERI1 exoribonuclease 3-like [Thrips palmi]|uniref:ERI1 exoribonuclease 3-like n=1 Tax=Thrips palmi TaxID=161013 RepID=A0A6P8XV17_THRPL|nr:ERI1 exoribonuclease 3-like [Thrips palmi]